jgi:hypothetical protein
MWCNEDDVEGLLEGNVGKSVDECEESLGLTELSVISPTRKRYTDLCCERLGYNDTAIGRMMGPGCFLS